MRNTARAPRRPRSRAGRLVPIALAVALCLGAPPTFVAAENAPKEAPAFVAPSVHRHRVVAYYFHTTYRCASCRTLEAWAREAVESAFAEELKDGRLVWKTVNIEVKGNEHFVKDYALYTKSLVLVNEVRGRAPAWKNLEKVWQLLGRKEAYFRYVQAETRAYLAPAS